MTEGPETPEALLCRIAQMQDRAAFERLFLHFAPRLNAYLRRSGSSSQLAEDLTQEVLLAVWRKAALFDPARASAAAWIFAIARNLRTDAFRRERHPSFDPADPGLMPPARAPADAEVMALQDTQAMQAALRELPADQSDVVAMFFFSESPHSEIATSLGIPLGTVKSRLRLALAKLRSGLRGVR